MAGWRTVVVSKRAKLDFKLNYIVVRGDTIKRIFIDEVNILLIESTAVSLTAYLMAELSKRNIKVIFCDSNRNPISEVSGYYGSYNSSLKVRNQIKWPTLIKEKVWTDIVFSKIVNQMNLLSALGYDEGKTLMKYLEELEHNDSTNREGHAAKVYFNALFGPKFSRKQDNIINTCLNYGYSILLSTVNREIVANGYITQLGLFHDNQFYEFNFGCDLMEPFRPLIDLEVIKMNPQKFESEEKHKILSIFDEQIKIGGRVFYFKNCINNFCKSVFNSLEGNDTSLYKHPELIYEL